MLYQDSFIANLLRLIQKMKPKPKKKGNVVKEQNFADMDDRQMKRALFPGLAMPNDPNMKVSLSGFLARHIIKLQNVLTTQEVKLVLFEICVALCLLARQTLWRSPYTSGS